MCLLYTKRMTGSIQHRECRARIALQDAPAVLVADMGVLPATQQQHRFLKALRPDIEGKSVVRHDLVEHAPVRALARRHYHIAIPLKDLRRLQDGESREPLSLIWG